MDGAIVRGGTWLDLAGRFQEATPPGVQLTQKETVVGQSGGAAQAGGDGAGDMFQGLC